MPQDLTDEKSTLVQVMAWCRQAPSHYLNQCWPRSPTPYDVTRPQWVKMWAQLQHFWCYLCIYGLSKHTFGMESMLCCPGQQAYCPAAGCLDTLRRRQNGRHFPDDIFKWVFLNENIWILLKISLKFVPKVRINNIPALVQIMAWHQPGDKPLSEPMMVSLLTADAYMYMHHSASMS